MYQKNSGETRKIQFTGKSTYIVSLPKNWIVQNQLQKGSEIQLIEEENGSLSIIPNYANISQKKPESTTIMVSSQDSSNKIIRKTVSAYLVGHNLLHIRSKEKSELSSKQRSTLKEFSRKMLVGTEIVTDTKNELILQVLLSYPELSVQSALRRMSIITASMQRDVIMSLKNADKQQAKEVLITDSEVDRFHLYIIRQLKTAIQNPRIIKEIGLNTARDCLGYRLITKSVERTADHASSIAKNILLLKTKLNKDTIDNLEKMSEVAISMFETAIESLFRQDYELAEGIIEKIKDVITVENKAVISLQTIDSEDVPHVRLIIESIRRIAEYASDIAEVILNLTIESVLFP